MRGVAGVDVAPVYLLHLLEALAAGRGLRRVAEHGPGSVRGLAGVLDRRVGRIPDHGTGDVGRAARGLDGRVGGIL